MKIPVSVVIPFFNSEETIKICLDSVLAQTYTPSEIICIDDFSTDKTLSILSKYQSKYGKKFFKIIKLDKNQGPSTARNTGWDSAKYEYIAFIDADDFWHPQKLEIQYNFMKKKNIILSGHTFSVSKECTSFPVIPKKIRSYSLNAVRLFISNKTPTPSIMLKKEITLRFQPGKYFAEDYLLWLQIVLSSNRRSCYYIHAPLVCLMKEPYGVAGLSKDLKAMHMGVTDTFARLYQEKRINLSILIMMRLFNTLKYYRRFLITAFRKSENEAC